MPEAGISIKGLKRNMKFLVRRYFSGFCSYEIEADDEISAYEKAKKLPLDEAEILCSLEECEDCDEVITARDENRET